MTYYIFDTNIWIYLANGYDPTRNHYEEELHFKLMDKIEDFIHNNEIALVVCDIIIDEWNRNKNATQKLIEKYQNRIESNKDTIQIMKKNLEEKDAALLEKLYEKYADNTQKIIEINKQHIERVESILLNKTIKAPIKDEVKVIAAERAIKKLAPFKGDKSNSMADACILFSSIDFLKEETDWVYRCAYQPIFVTTNKKDFSDPSDAKLIHLELKPFLEDVNMLYETNIGSALNKIGVSSFNDKELKLLEEASEIYWDNLTFCEMCSPHESSLSLNIVEFDETILIENELYVAPNQIELFSFEDFKNSSHTNSVSEINSVQIGSCTYCNTEYLKCQNCDTATYIPDQEVNNELECEGCGIKYQISYSYVGSGMNERVIRIVGG